MAQPTPSTVHAVDVPLTNISTAYVQASSDFIATKVFPVVPVQKQTDKYYTYTKASWFTDEAKVRAPGTESAGSGYGLSTASYSCDVFAFHKDVDDQVRANADAGINVDSDATRFVTQRLLLRQEIQWTTDYFATSVWGTDSTPTNLWSDQTASNPISDVEAGKRTVLSNTGFLPNTLTLGYNVFEQLKQHPDIVDRIKYTTSVTGRTITPELLAQMFDVSNVYVCKAVKQTAVENETAAYSFVQGKHALLCYVPPNAGLMTPAAGYTFTWQGVSMGMGANIGIKRFRMENNAADRIEGQIAFDNKVVGTDLGYFFASCVS